MDYDNALPDPGGIFSRDELRSASFYENPNNHSFIWDSGKFAAVTKAKIGGKDWAVRLLIRNQPYLADRYQAIDRRPENLNRYFVETRFLPEEIQVDPLTGRFPVVLIEWIEGETLGEFVRRACVRRDVQSLATLNEALNRLRQDLSAARIAHGDLSTSNILVEGGGSTPRLRLVDYDSLWIPHLCEFRCSVGLGGLQHPKRPNPIGSSADTAAFGMFTVGLDLLCANPTLAGKDPFDGDGFLITVSQLLAGEDPIARSFLQLRRGRLLQEYLEDSVDAHCRVWDEESESSSFASAVGNEPSEHLTVGPLPKPIPPQQPEPTSKSPSPPPVVNPDPEGAFKSTGESFGDQIRMGRIRTKETGNPTTWSSQRRSGRRRPEP